MKTTWKIQLVQNAAVMSMLWYAHGISFLGAEVITSFPGAIQVAGYFLQGSIWHKASYLRGISLLLFLPILED